MNSITINTAKMGKLTFDLHYGENEIISNDVFGCVSQDGERIVTAVLYTSVASLDRILTIALQQLTAELVHDTIKGYSTKDIKQQIEVINKILKCNEVVTLMTTDLLLTVN